jgi:putative tryptophan/tyrosine transport system substrate-binding protein
MVLSGWKRRDVVALLGRAAAAWPFGARAQRRSMRVIGVLSPEAPTTGDVEGLRIGLRELGYVEGEHIRYEYRWSGGNFDRLFEMAEELVHLNVDVIVTYVTQASLAAKKATTAIPIVMVGVADPVGVGLIASLARPGGNVTGTSSIAAVLAAKQVELLKETVPNVSRFAALWNPANLTFQTLQLRQAETAAESLGVELQLLETRSPKEFDGAFAAMEADGTRALVILLDPLFIINFKKLVELSVKGRLVTITGYRKFVDAGGLMAYGPNYFDIYKYAAVYVDRILKGAKPADLPVEQPTTFEFVVNLKTAKAIGIDVPTSILLRATHVIE